MHNGEELAIRLSWIDPTTDDRAVRHEEFRDAVAIQFSLSSDPPFYMGDTSEHGGVNIWMWKADRQANIAEGYKDVDAAFPDRAVDMYPEQRFQLVDMSVTEWPHEHLTKHDPEFITAWGAGNLVADPNLDTPVECLVARGPGTLSGKPANLQLVKGQAVYERGLWYVQLQRTMTLSVEDGHGDERMFKPGDYQFCPGFGGPSIDGRLWPCRLARDVINLSRLAARRIGAVGDWRIPVAALTQRVGRRGALLVSFFASPFGGALPFFPSSCRNFQSNIKIRLAGINIGHDGVVIP